VYFKIKKMDMIKVFKMILVTYLKYNVLLHIINLFGFFPIATRSEAGVTRRVVPKHRTRSASVACSSAACRTGPYVSAFHCSFSKSGSLHLFLECILKLKKWI
jgi:hypothetical protein